MARFGADWTPTVMIHDADGNERHRIEGYLPADDFLAQLHLGIAHAAFKDARFEQAEEGFRDVVGQFPGSDAAPEAQYWAGVARYKRTNEYQDLIDTNAAFRDKYSDSPWAKKASVWQ